jgi:phage tail-like protein
MMAAEDGQIAGMAHILYETHPAFRYLVEIAGVTVGAFTECTLPTMEIDTEDLREGGLNTYTHLLPKGRKAARLTLKNGLGKNDLMTWCIEIMQEKFTRKEIIISLHSARFSAGQKEPICTWNLHDAYPVKWTGPQLQADSNAIAFQTIEFACGLVEMVVGDAIID